MPEDNVKHSEPIPIGPRRRAASVSSSSASSSSPTSPQTPISPIHPGRIQTSTSPILSYFLAQSPSKTSATFPFKRNFAPPVFEEEESQEGEVPVAAHARRATTAVAGRFAQQQQAPAPPFQDQRGTGVLRRLSLGGTFARSPIPGHNTFASPPQPPSPPPNTAATPTGPSFASAPPQSPRSKGRRATLSTESRPHRAPSPMGERILKGHFDGFN